MSSQNSMPELEENLLSAESHNLPTSALRTIFLRLFPADSKRGQAARKLYDLSRGQLVMLLKRSIRRKLESLTRSSSGQAAYKILKSLVPEKMKRFLNEFKSEFSIPNRSMVTLFADPDILPNYSPRRDLKLLIGQAKNGRDNSVKVSLIATTLNEASQAKAWFDSLLLQTRLPDEIVITDGGSSDGTAEVIRQLSVDFPISIKVIDTNDTNISQGRNLAIQNASYQVIACTDFGCTLEQHWLEYLILPFEVDAHMDVSSGFSNVLQTKGFAKLASPYFFCEITELDPKQFVPSSRSFAFKKVVWEKAGGYPEYLTDAGEDTLFVMYARLVAQNWAFVPEAIVYWSAPSNLKKLYKTFYRYSQGNGEVGLYASLYWRSAKYVLWLMIKGIVQVLIFAVLMWLVFTLIHPWAAWILLGLSVLIIGIKLIQGLRYHMRRWGIEPGLALQCVLMPYAINLAQPLGFAAGVRNRKPVRQRRIKPYIDQLQQILEHHPDRPELGGGVIIYPPTHDWGFMFQLPHQMARSFSQLGFVYFYLTNNELTDSVIGFQEIEPNLYLCNVPIEVFRGLKQPIVYIGSPWHCTLVDKFQHPLIVYDHYDDLKVSSGRLEDHQILLKKADVVIVTAQRLLDDVKAIRSDALFVPNGVDVDYIARLRPRVEEPPPIDLQPILERGKPIIGYSGALSLRVDYELLHYLAIQRTDLEFVMIGVSFDGTLERSQLLEQKLDNLHWLGMKSYDDLFRYMWRFDVGIIPFLINDITQATTSIKIFEYMACNVPVISTAMPESKRYPGVLIGETYEQFAELIDKALLLGRDPQYLDTIRRVAKERSWKKRVEAILKGFEDR